jgi:3-dehydroquinate synthase
MNMKFTNSLAATVNLGERSYKIFVGKGLLGNISNLIKSTNPRTKKTAVITSSIINDIYGERVQKALKELETEIFIVPEGEKAKSLDWAIKLVNEFLESGMDRNSCVISFGGGSIGDLAGFVASIYLRGIKLIQVPTSLLAMVDSSIGGKTAVNHDKGKNLIGTFYQPSVVISDPLILRTLPMRELKSGMGEIIKYSIIHDTPLFHELDKNAHLLLEANPDILTSVIKKCVIIKSWYVERDERDLKGLRVALNYGHTVGHALEKLTNHSIKHGEAISIGMEIAAKISTKLGVCQKKVVIEQHRLLEKMGLDTNLPDLKPENIVEIMRRDKKSESSNIRMVLPTGIGKPIKLRQISEQIILEVLGEKD